MHFAEGEKWPRKTREKTRAGWLSLCLTSALWEGTLKAWSDLARAAGRLAAQLRLVTRMSQNTAKRGVKARLSHPCAMHSGTDTMAGCATAPLRVVAG